MKKIIAFLLAASMLMACASGCKRKNPNSGSESESTPSGTNKYVPTAAEENTPLVFGIEGADGVFSPYFSTAAYDSEIVGMTQIGMLTSEGGTYKYGNNYACVAEDLDITYIDSNNAETTDPNKAAYTRYDFLIKNGIKFSDGKPLTIKDVLFNLYLFLDPAYSGSSTIYSTDIVGLKKYRFQSDDDKADVKIDDQATTRAGTRLNRLSQWLTNQFLLNEVKGNKAEFTDAQRKMYTEGLDTYEKEIKKDFKFFLPLFEDEINKDYESAQSSLEESIKETAYEAGEYWQLYLYNWGVIKRKQNIDKVDIKIDAEGNQPATKEDEEIKDENGVYKYRYYFDWEDDYKYIKDDLAKYLADNPTKDPAEAKKEFAINLVKSANFGDDVTADSFDVSNAKPYELGFAYEKLATMVAYSGSSGELINEMTVSERTKIVEETSANKEKVRSISGVTYKKTTSFRNETAKTQYDLNEEHDMLSITINKIDPKAIWNFAFTVAPLHYYSYEGADSESEWNVNNNYGVRYNDDDFIKDVLKSPDKLGVPVGAGAYMASKEGGLNGAKYPTKTEFRSNNRIYYERNPYFDTLDENIPADPIQNAKVKYFQYKIVNSSFLLDSLQKNEIDVGTPTANYKNIQRVNGISHLASTQVDTNGYGYVGINAKAVPDVWMRRAIIKAMNTAMTVDYFTSNLASQIYRPMSKQSWAYPDFKDSAFSFTDDDGYYVDYAYDDSAQDILQMLQDHGYTVAGGKVTGAPTGYDLKTITFTVAGESTDHPAWQMFTNAKEVLAKIGIKVDVMIDQFALKKLASGQLAVWAAAWSSTIDPDMYQVYHKLSTAGSTLNWGYDEIKKGGKYSYELGLINELSDLIDLARESTDNSKNGTRAQRYWDALDLVMELAVELPTYQRKDLTVYNKEKLDSATLNQNPTSFDGLFSRLWEVGYVR